MAANKTIGGINVTITATVDKFAKSMRTARRLLANFAKSIKNTIFSVKGLAVALAGGAFVKFTVDQFQAIDAMKDLSDKLGVATDKLAGLQLAADEAGISSTVLERALTVLSNKTGRRGDLALRDWVEQTAKLSTHQEKLAAATEMFGIRGASMVRMLEGGTAALDEAQQAAEAMGVAVSRASAIGVDRALEAFGRFKLAVGGIFRSIAVESAPYLEFFSNRATDFLTDGGRGKSIGAAIVDAIVEMAKFVADAIAKMVASVEHFIGDAKVALIAFRTSAVGKSMGMGFANGQELLRAWASAGSNFTAAKNLRNNLPSASIQQFVDDAKKFSAEQAKKNQPGILDNLLARGKAAIGPTATNIEQIGGNLWHGFAKGVQSLPRLMLRGWWEANKWQANNWQMKAAASSSRSALSFAEAGSAESYRQQAAIRRQNENIPKKQLGVQKEMARALASIDRKTAPVMEARLT